MVEGLIEPVLLLGEEVAVFFLQLAEAGTLGLRRRGEGGEEEEGNERKGTDESCHGWRRKKEMKGEVDFKAKIHGS